jgi:hypothetical protein
LKVLWTFVAEQLLFQKVQLALFSVDFFCLLTVGRVSLLACLIQNPPPPNFLAQDAHNFALSVQFCYPSTAVAFHVISVAIFTDPWHLQGSTFGVLPGVWGGLANIVSLAGMQITLQALEQVFPAAYQLRDPAALPLDRTIDIVAKLNTIESYDDTFIQVEIAMNIRG